jgi:hypothetical protein
MELKEFFKAASDDVSSLKELKRRLDRMSTHWKKDGKVGPDYVKVRGYVVLPFKRLRHRPNVIPFSRVQKLRRRRG